MSTNKKPGSDHQDDRPQQDSNRSVDYGEGSRKHEGFDVSNSRPAPSNPHRERDPDKEREK